MADPAELKRSWAQALKFLSYRDRTRSELSEKLEKKGFSRESIDQTMESLVREGLVNDARFALNWGRSRITGKRVGELRLRRELSGKGLDSETVEKTLGILYSEFNEEELARSGGQKKLSLLKNLEPLVQKRRLAQYLYRKGFSSDTVYKTVKELISDHPADHLS